MPEQPPTASDLVSFILFGGHDQTVLGKVFFLGAASQIIERLNMEIPP